MTNLPGVANSVCFSAWSSIAAGTVFLVAQQWFAAIVVLGWGGAHQAVKSLVHASEQDRTPTAESPIAAQG